MAKYFGGKVLTAVLVVLAFGCGLWAWKHPEELAAIGHALKYIAIWLGLALVLPWASFPLVPWIVRRDSNRVAAALLVGLVVLDALAAWWLSDFSITGVLAHMSCVLGLLCAAVYNYVVCNFLADRIEESL